VLAGVVVALFSLVATPAGAAPSETTAALRAKRQVLVARIASLTDAADEAQARLGELERGRAMTTAALAVVRKRFARHAVNAYLDGVTDAEAKRLRRKAWDRALSSTDTQLLGDLRAATLAAETQQANVRAALRDATELRAQLDAARVALERTIADRVTWERAAARSGAGARRAAMTSTPTRAPRHARATGSQSQLMQRYRFGPGDVPPGLVRSGEVLQGKASWYGPGFDGRTTASGAIFDQEGWTVAHKTLPLGTILLVSYGGRSVVVLVNDRGPYVAGRILDLSHGVAAALGTTHAGVATVRAEVLVPA
jgi:hypothetical protein